MRNQKFQNTPIYLNISTKALIGLVLFCFAIFGDRSFAHTNSVCYINSGLGAVTFWYGSWHSGTSYNEGELKLSGTGATSYGPAIVEFSQLVHTTPAGCTPGTNYFNTDGSDLIAYGSNTGIKWESHVWQGVTFTGLAVGSYTFEYIPIGHAESSFTGTPTQDWEPISGISVAAVTLDSSDIGNEVSLSSTVPVDNATEVNLTVRTVELVFDQVVNAGSGAIKLIKSASNTLVESLDISSGNVSGSGTNTITARWTSALEHSTDYCIQIDNTALRATDGTAFDGISDNTTLNFTTMGLPYLISTLPVDNTTGISIATQNLKLTFNEVVNKNNGNISLVRTTTGQTVESFDVAGNKIQGWGSNVLTINLSETLSVGTGYHILIGNNAIKNSGSVLYGGIADETTFNFTTSTDGIVTLINSTPSDNAQNVAVDNRKLFLTFSDAVILGTGGIYLYSSAEEELVYSIDVSSNEVIGSGSATITVYWPDWLKPNTDYHVNIDSTAFTNSEGQIYSGISNKTSLNFKTTSRLTSPWEDPDITAIIEAQTELVDRRLYESIRPILNRLTLFRVNRHLSNKSRNDIKIDVIHPTIEEIRNTPSIEALLEIEDEFVDQISDLVDIDPPKIEKDWAIWSAGDISVGKVGKTSLSSSRTAHSDWVTIGIDKKVDSTRLFGMAFRGGYDKTEIGLKGTHVDTFDFGIAVYNTWVISDQYFIDLIIGANQFLMKSHRNLGFGNTIFGERKAYQGYHSMSFHRKINFETLLITPYSRLDAGYTNLRPFEESGGNAAISFHEQHVRHAKANVGLQLDYFLNTWIGEFRPYSRIEYTLDLSNSSVVSASYVTDPNTLFHSTIHDLRGTNWKYGLGFDFKFILGWFRASYEHIEESDDNRQSEITRKSNNISLKLYLSF